MTEEVVHLFLNLAIKFWSEGETNLQQKREKLNYDMLTLMSNMRFIFILRSAPLAPTV